MLLAGGGHADIPMIKAAQTLGFHVVTSGNRANDLGHAYGDEVHLADFSDREAILNLARDLRVDAVMPSCNDFSALSCAWAAQELGLPGHDSYDVARRLHHKDLYRAFAKDTGIATPRAASCKTIEDGIAATLTMTFPVIVKPVDLTGGKGISVARDFKELKQSLARAINTTRAGRVVVEEFIEGTHHGFTCLIKERRVIFHFMDNEHYFINPYMVSAASAPSSAPRRAREKIREAVEQIAEKMNLVDGIVHVQFILNGQSPIIIEICRRPPGDLYVELVRHATGVDYPSLIVRAACGIEYGDVQQVEPQGHFIRHCIMSSQQGRISGLKIDQSITDKIIDKMLWWKPGDMIDDVMTQKLGIMFLKFDHQDEMDSMVKNLQILICPQFQ